MADPTPVFPKLQMNTHMPFFDGETLLFCGSEVPVEHQFSSSGNLQRRMVRDKHLREHFKGTVFTSKSKFREWKLFYCSLSQAQPIRLQTGLPSNTVECSPTFYIDGGKFHVSFIAGNPTEHSLAYHFYAMEGDSFESLSAAQLVFPMQMKIACMNQKYTCLGMGNQLTFIERKTGTKTYLISSLQHILRISFLSDNVEAFVITGVAMDGSRKTLLYNFSTGVVQEFQASLPVYKSAAFGDRLITPSGTDKTVEGYRLFMSSFSLANSQETMRINATPRKLAV